MRYRGGREGRNEEGWRFWERGDRKGWGWVRRREEGQNTIAEAKVSEGERRSARPAEEEAWISGSATGAGIGSGWVNPATKCPQTLKIGKGGEG